MFRLYLMFGLHITDLDIWFDLIKQNHDFFWSSIFDYWKQNIVLRWNIYPWLITQQKLSDNLMFRLHMDIVYPFQSVDFWFDCIKEFRYIFIDGKEIDISYYSTDSSPHIRSYYI